MVLIALINKWLQKMSVLHTESGPKLTFDDNNSVWWLALVSGVNVAGDVGPVALDEVLLWFAAVQGATPEEAGERDND